MELHKRYHWFNPDNGRYYEAWASTNLFGDWELVRIWGKMGTALGRMVMTPIAEMDAVQTLAQIAKTRQRRGYRNRY